MDVNELFKNFLEEIEQVVSLNVYNLWFSKIRPISLEGNTLKIVVPMDIHKSMLSENYKECRRNHLKSFQAPSHATLQKRYVTVWVARWVT